MRKIKLRHLWISGCTALLACSTATRIARNVDSATSGAYGTGSTGPGSTVPSIAVGRGADEDEHRIQPDDFFIADQEYRQGSISVHLAKMTAPPASTTKNEAQFFRLDQSKDFWTANYWKTRVASSADLQIGASLIFFKGNIRDGVYQPPQDKQHARTTSWASGWWMARLTDTSDLYKGAVTIDTFRCSPNALRVPMK
jgi:hypothetical protein